MVDMSSMVQTVLAPAGSSGSNTHTSVSVATTADQYALKFRITSVGSTPSITFKLQGSLETQAIPDSASDWYDLAMLPSNTSGPSEVSSANESGAGTYVYFVSTLNRFALKVRLVTSGNTNVIYDAALMVRDVHQ